MICGRYKLSLERPLIMGILNVTPDSFSDGGRYMSRDQALRQAERCLSEGADLLDIGGESTRPGAASVSLNEELDRVLPIIEILKDCGCPISVDTYKPDVMRAALAAGADMINDVYGFQMAGALEAVSSSACGLCVMHSKGTPKTMQLCPEYEDVVQDVRDFFIGRVNAFQKIGIDLNRICLDPGFGFGKKLEHNLALLRALPELTYQKLPMLVGLSRKSMLGEITGQTAPSERLSASIAAMLYAVSQGAALVRVHDVRASVDALKFWRAVNKSQ